MKVLSIFRGKAILVEMPLTYAVLKKVVGEGFALFKDGVFVFVYNPNFYLSKNNKITLLYKGVAFGGRIIVFQTKTGEKVPFEFDMWKWYKNKFHIFDDKCFDYYRDLDNNYSFDYSVLEDVSPLDFYLYEFGCWRGQEFNVCFDFDGEYFMASHTLIQIGEDHLHENDD